MPNVTMPKLSDTMEEGKVLRWLKRPGDPVAVGDLLVEVETDKADMEVEASLAGVLSEVRLAEGESAPVGAVIAVIDDSAQPTDGASPPAENEAASEPAPRAQVRELERPTSGRAAATPPRAPQAGASPVKRISPPSPPRPAEPPRPSGGGSSASPERKPVEEAAPSRKESSAPRREKAEPAPPPGSPGSGTVQVRPPPRAASARSEFPSSGDVQRIPLSGMRASIARRMTESKREAPHFYVTTTVDMELAVGLRTALKAKGGAAAGVTYNHLVLKACADALAAHPALNARFAGDAIEILPDVNLGMATALPEGLIVPVIHHADRLSLLEIAARARELYEKARQRSFTSEDLSGATFSVSNLGMHEVDSFTAVLNPPQAGILAVGSVRQRPVVRSGALAVAHTLHLTLSCDHRAVDGVQAAEFLTDVRGRLENPIGLLIPDEEN